MRDRPVLRRLAWLGVFVFAGLAIHEFHGLFAGRATCTGPG